MRRADVVLVLVLMSVGCGTEPTPTGGMGQLGGRVVISGPLRGAALSIDQLDLKTGDVRVHVTDTTADQDGKFSAEIGLANGLLRVTATGGSFVDLATGVTIQLDPTDELRSLVHLDLDEVRDDLIVSPVTHLIDARAQWKLTQMGDITKALDAAREHIDRHFGNVDWSSVHLVGLDQPATSPTEPVRAALVQAALSVLAKDIGTAAESSPQDVNVYTLVQRWADDIGRGDGDGTRSVFDGNDANADAPGTGLQLGTCGALPAPCNRPSGCSLGVCRTLCDLYAGSPRALLAGAMTKVIQDNDPNNPAALNKTQLKLSDTLAIARSINDNVDDDLFGDACIEQLDRLPPSITFLAPSPAEGAYAGGTVTLKVSAIDDTDATPRVTFLGYTDSDGDPGNSVAIATIDTTAMPDGAANVQVTAIDMSGNAATVTRNLLVDNTLPALSLDSASFLVDGATWWTATATPMLQGTVGDAAPVAVKAVINGVDVLGVVTGTSWTVAVPAGSLDAAGTAVTVVATDAAGNRREIMQRIRPDVTPPALSFQASTVNDEAGDQVAFATDESPIHTHAGTAIDLAAGPAATCAQLTKFSNLLGPSSPTFVTELPTRNPIAYQLVGADDGVGIAPGSTEYRVRRRDGGGGFTMVLDWTSAGAGSSIGTGAQLFAVAIQSDIVAELATTQATYDVEFRTVDRLARTSTSARCFDLQLRAPPLHFLAGGPTNNQPFALDALNAAPGAAYDNLAERLLNSGAGASLIDQPLTNGTTSTVYLTVTVTKPSAVTVSQQFAIRSNTTVTSVNTNCANTPSACNSPLPFPGNDYQSGTTTSAANSLTFPVRLYELNASGLPSTSFPCLAPCTPTSSVFTFAVPPRSATGAARRFVAMTMIGQVTALWPQDSAYAAAAPFSDSSYSGFRYTGTTRFSSSGCTQTVFQGGDPYCRQRTSRAQYQILTYAALSFSGNTLAGYATAPTATIAPAPAAPNTIRASGQNWQTFEGTLP